MTTLKVILKGRNTKGEQITNSRQVYEAMKFLEKEDRENLYVLHLDTKNQIISKELIAKGTLDGAPASCREVFKGAILNNSQGILCVHNHPSGDPTPSPADFTITDRLREAGELIGIQMIDHVVIGQGKYCSIFEIEANRGAKTKKGKATEERIVKFFEGSSPIAPTGAVERLISPNQRRKSTPDVTLIEVKVKMIAVYRLGDLFQKGCVTGAIVDTYEEMKRSTLPPPETRSMLEAKLLDIWTFGDVYQKDRVTETILNSYNKLTNKVTKKRK